MCAVGVGNTRPRRGPARVMQPTALILGGTGESRDLARLLRDAGWTVTSSLAGRVSTPRLPVGQVRIGGFGGPAGLARWIVDNGVDVVVDATHPFAEKISLSAAEACKATGAPLVRLQRPQWEEQPGDRWTHVSSMQEAAQRARRYSHVFLAIGRQQLAPFAQDPHALYVIRCVEEPSVELPPRHRILLSRGPFDLDSEKKLLIDNQIDVVVTKNSGGPTYNKLVAARELGVDVIVVDRPALPKGHSAIVATAKEAYDTCEALL